MILLDTSNNDEDEGKRSEFDLLQRYVSYLTLTLLHRIKQHRVGIAGFSGKAYRLILSLTDNLDRAQETINNLKYESGYACIWLLLNGRFLTAKMTSTKV